MDIYIYSDESGVFDYKHNQFFVYGGIIFLSKGERDECSRKYSNAEKTIRNNYPNLELKATIVSNKDKGKLFRSLNSYYKFGGIIKQEKLLQTIFDNKKSKQRYLDYAYKISIKRALGQLIKDKAINPDEVRNLYFFVDEHSTATNGRYELREALEQELKIGTYNFNYSSFYSPIFPKLKTLQLSFCNSSSKTLIRSADIIANRIYYQAVHEQPIQKDKLFITYFP